MSNSRRPLCVFSPFRNKASEGHGFSYCITFPSRVSFAVIGLRGISISVCVSTRKWDCSVSVLFFCRLIKYASTGCYLEPPADQYTCLFFYEIPPKRGLVNLSEIISEAGGVIDCGSDGKENQVGLTLTSRRRYSICLIVANWRCWEAVSVSTHRTVPIFRCARPAARSLINTAEYKPPSIIPYIHHRCLMHFFPPPLLRDKRQNRVTWGKQNNECRTITKVWPDNKVLLVYAWALVFFPRSGGKKYIWVWGKPAKRKWANIYRPTIML